MIPVTGDFIEVPQRRRHGLVAHLLGHRDAVGLHLAVSVVGADADKNAALPADQDEFNLAARLIAADFDAIGGGQPPRGDTIIDRGRCRRRNTDPLEFGDVFIARDRIAAGPAGDNGLIDRQRQRGRRSLGLDRECKTKHG